MSGYPTHAAVCFRVASGDGSNVQKAHSIWHRFSIVVRLAEVLGLVGQS
jgi:hypothetical protein